jgi:hypothetical protein
MRISIGLSVLALTLAAAHAQDPAAPDDFTLVQGVLALLQVGSGGITQEEILARLTKPIRQFDRNGDGLDLADAASQMRIEEAAMRAAALAPLLTYDLDGDRIVTRAELAETLAYPSAFASGGGEQLFAARDADKDGTLSWEELTLLDERQTDRIRRMGVEQFLESVSAFAPEYRGRFTLDDASALVPVIMPLLDKDGNGIATPEEIRTLQVAATRAPAAEPAPVSCDMPDVPAGAEELLVGIYEGNRYASVNLGDITEDTGFSEIRVEEGEAPLYVVLSAYSGVVWNFTGQIDRVSTVVVSSYKPGGVVGIDAGKVAFLEGHDCLARAYEFPSVDGIRVTAQLRNLLGAEVAVGGAYALSQIAVPSMMVDDASRDSERGKPAVIVDPATVVSNTEVSTFEVLPGRAGIRQLLDNGSLEPIEGGFRIVKPIPHYPAGLHGAYSEHFILGKGVPKPGGDPGHSCVISEEDGSIVDGGPC